MQVAEATWPDSGIGAALWLSRSELAASTYSKLAVMDAASRLFLFVFAPFALVVLPYDPESCLGLRQTRFMDHGGLACQSRSYLNC